LTCNANSSGYPVSGTVSFGNNDSDETPFSFSVTCTVNVVPIPPPPAINIGNPDTTFYTLVCPPPLVFTVSPSISTGSGYDFVYYERYADLGGGNYGILLDLVKVEISADNSTWYTVFNWGDGSPDTNTNLAGFSPETDNYPIPEASLFNGSGILINIDPIVPPGYYPYMRFTGDCGVDGAEIDAIELLH